MTTFLCSTVEPESTFKSLEALRNWMWRILFGQLHGFMAVGKDQVRALGIATMFDLYSTVEVARSNSKTAIAEIDTVSVPKVAMPVLSIKTNA